MEGIDTGTPDQASATPAKRVRARKSVATPQEGVTAPARAPRKPRAAKAVPPNAAKAEAVGKVEKVEAVGKAEKTVKADKAEKTVKADNAEKAVKADKVEKTVKADKAVSEEQQSKPEAAAKDKARKVKLVRDSFTMPEPEYAVLAQVKKMCIKSGVEIKKSELLRIGVALIAQLDMDNLKMILQSLPQLKAGRPKNV